jgi:succinate-acetate transporter protein
MKTLAPIGANFFPAKLLPVVLGLACFFGGLINF